MKKKEKLPSEIEKFVRVVKIGKTGGTDYWDAYQIEQVTIQDDVVIKKERLDKQDTKQMTLAKAELMLNPEEVPGA